MNLRRIGLWVMCLCVLPACEVGRSVLGGDVDTGVDVVDSTVADAPADEDVTVDAPDAPDVADAPDVVDARVPGTCRDDSECVGSSDGTVCDVATQRCVACTAERNACPVGQYCDTAARRCQTGCRDDDACAAAAGPADAGSMGDDAGRPPGRHCEPATRACVECLTDAHCPAGNLCVGNLCVPGCTADRGCDRGLTCCSGGCVDTQSNTASCGGCGTRCAAPNAVPSCMNGMCTVAMCVAPYADCDARPDDGCEVDTRTDMAHCGGCGRVCAPRPHDVARCEDGTCRHACEDGYADCDGDPANGCETDTRVSTDHCGACGRACNPPNGTAVCRAGACAVSRCNDGFGDCDTNPTNGCETDTRVAVLHCGMCGTSCPSHPNASPTCVAGACATVCTSGFQDCDGDAANGCEADLRTSSDHCGACGRACRVTGGAGVCASGSCAVMSCNAGRADCDRDVTTGCEVDTTTATAHCGGCGMACPTRAAATATCAAGACGFTCNTGAGNCDGDASNGCETNTLTAAAHCGGCGMACAARANTTATCAAGACQYACATGFADCDGDASNGCEVDLRSDASHCGTCSTTCRVAGGAGVCSAGSCSVRSCDPGRADCDMSVANGCETDVANDLRACGACGVACPARASATATCAMGACGFTCVTGFGDCDRVADNGCEVDTRAATAHCGGCGMPCAARANTAASCASGACQYACLTGFADCDGNASNGCEVDLRTSNDHCGACGRACRVAGGTGVCSAGACAVAGCDAGRANCDADATNGCETDVRTDLRACGGCGVVCPARASATTTCSAGACGFTCNAGAGDCDGNAANGCETSTLTAVAHCGGCGMACAARPNTAASCAAGACQYACVTGFADCDGNASNGCEVDTRTTLSSCGACGRACSVASGTPACVGGACTVASCNAGYADCDGSAANGCEVILSSSNTSCGACGVACPSGQSCYAGRCSAPCGVTGTLGFAGCTNVALAGAASAVSTYLGQVPAFGNDGNLCSAWNAGGYAPRSWTVDLGAARAIRGVTLVPEMQPSPASVVHAIEVSTDGATFRTVTGVSQVMGTSGVYPFDFGTPVSARYVRVSSSGSPSWIAWREIAVFSCP